MGHMPVPIMPAAGRERATEGTQACVFLKQFADRMALPTCLQRIRQNSCLVRRSRSTGRACEREKRRRKPCPKQRRHGQYTRFFGLM